MNIAILEYHPLVNGQAVKSALAEQVLYSHFE